MKRKHFRAAQSLTTRQEGLHIFNPLHTVNFSSDFPCLMIIFLKLSVIEFRNFIHYNFKVKETFKP